jgi:hypothetical protein
LAHHLSASSKLIALRREVVVIRRLHASVRKNSRQMVKDIVAIGEHLTKAKALVGHGNWANWLTRHFAWSVATAENYMALAKFAQHSKFTSLTNLPTITVEALYALAKAKRMSDQTVDAVIARAEDGERISAATVRQDTRQVRITVEEEVRPPRRITYVREPEPERPTLSQPPSAPEPEQPPLPAPRDSDDSDFRQGQLYIGAITNCIEQLATLIARAPPTAVAKGIADADPDAVARILAALGGSENKHRALAADSPDRR